MNAPKIFAAIRKVDEQKRMVFGRIAEEAIDKSDEMMDYEQSKPYFKAWSDEIAKDTDGKSLGNVRAMHGKTSAGVLKSIEFNDETKCIDVAAKIVDDNEWNKVLEGCYTGFSIGGSYVGDKVVTKIDDRDVKKYVAKPNEVSIVDRPCLPSAKFFEVQKADGSTAQVEFKEPQADAAALAKQASAEDGASIEGTPDQVDALTKLMNMHKLNVAKVIKLIEDVTAGELVKKEVPVDLNAALEKFDTAKPLRKSMYSCATFANVLASLISLKSSAAYEAYQEGDSSTLPARIGAVIALAGEVFKEMIDEAIEENGAGTEVPQPMLAMAEALGDLAKHEGSPIEVLLKGSAAQGMHDKAVAMGATCGAKKAETVDDLLKADLKGQVEKMVADATAPLMKALSEANEKITKLEAQPAPAQVSLRAVSKAEDNGADERNADTLRKLSQPIEDAHGVQHEAAGLIKAEMAKGGKPLLFRG